MSNFFENVAKEISYCYAWKSIQWRLNQRVQLQFYLSDKRSYGWENYRQLTDIIELICHQIYC